SRGLSAHGWVFVLEEGLERGSESFGCANLLQRAQGRLPHIVILVLQEVQESRTSRLGFRPDSKYRFRGGGADVRGLRSESLNEGVNGPLSNAFEGHLDGIHIRDDAVSPLPPVDLHEGWNGLERPDSRKP